MQEIGNSLREARIRRGLTIKDVEDATKIRSKYLEALEEDDFEVLPGATFVKAFLRTYASFLKLDADALIDSYRSHYEPREESAVLRADQSKNLRSARNSRSRSGSSGARRGADTKKPRARRGQRGYVLIGILALIAVALLAWFGSGRGQKPASIDANSIAGSTTTAVGSGGSTTTVAGILGTSTTLASGVSSSGSTDVTTGTTLTGATSEGNVTLVLTVKSGNCWLVVREDSENGAEIYAGTLSAGGQQTFNTAKRYWMQVGLPELLVLSVNGTTYTLSPPAGNFVVTGAGVERAP